MKYNLRNQMNHKNHNSDKFRAQVEQSEIPPVPILSGIAIIGARTIDNITGFQFAQINRSINLN